MLYAVLYAVLYALVYAELYAAELYAVDKLTVDHRRFCLKHH